MAYASEAEVILFYGSNGISNGLIYQDFEAVLDGVVPMQEFRGRLMKAAYATVNSRLAVTGLVLFTIAFDESGIADRGWNIPLRTMIERADRGPDLGAGPVRLVCRSQCPISWHQDRLWDPNMRQGENDFVFARDFIRDRGRNLGLTFSEEPEPAASAPNWGVPPPPGQQNYPSPPPYSAPPTYGAPPPGYGQPAPAQAWAQQAAPAGSAAYAGQPAAVAPAWGAPPVAAPAPTPDPNAAAMEQMREERVKLARTIKDLRLQVTTLEAQQADELAKLNYGFQQKEEILNSQFEKLLGQFKSLKAQNAALREQANAQRAQIDSLHEALDRQAQEAADGQSQIEEVRRQLEMELNQRLEEESARLREELHVREMDLINRDEKIEMLREEISDLKRAQVASQETGADKFLEKLEKLGVNFIVFHPGAGHISIPFKNIQRYVENPLGYAAEKCLVTEDRYKAWLAHYENPVCSHVKPDGKACGTRLIRVDVPSKFKPGDSDLCPKCQGDKNIANVLAFR